MSEAPLRVGIVGPGWWSETMFVTYVNDEVALTARGYDLRAGGLGLFVTEGAATFRDVRVRTADAGPLAPEESDHDAD
mgnify:CR=1 FL=1